EVGELRNRRVRVEHVAGDRLSHPRHLLATDGAVTVGLGRAGRRDALGGLGFRLGLAAANVIADVFLGDAIAGGADAAEVDAELAGQAANGGAGGCWGMSVAGL